MAIGDAVVVTLGAATENYQPSAGVEVQITFMCKTGTTDNLYSTGTDTITVMAAAGRGDTDTSATRNIAWMITNTEYARKGGTSDYAIITGVTTNV